MLWKPVALPRQLPVVQNPLVFASVARLLCLCLSCAGPSRPRSRPRCPTHVVGVLCVVFVYVRRVCRLCVLTCVHVMRVMFMCVSCVWGVCARVVAGCAPAAPSWSAGGTSVLSERLLTVVLSCALPPWSLLAVPSA